jgi:hypothetical protein
MEKNNYRKVILDASALIALIGKNRVGSGPNYYTKSSNV